jgi:uncharacterized protein (TIGR02678 family)
LSESADEKRRGHLDSLKAHERRTSVRALLRQPLLSAAGPLAAEFGMIRKHADWLRDWFLRQTGWVLTVDSELARLRKVTADGSDGTRPARDATTHSPFNRRRYVLLCLALAALERADRQTTLGRLAEQIVALTVAEPLLAAEGIEFDLTGHDQRKDLVQVVRMLLEYRVLARVHGDEHQFVTGRGDALYNVSRPTLAAMLCVRRPPSSVDAETTTERVASITEETVPDTEDGRNRRLRTRIMRRLLDDPVTYFDDLLPDERAYLTTQRALLLRNAEEATGLTPEIRREGIALVDEAGDLTDVRLPDDGTDGHAALLVAEFLADCARRGEAVSIERVQQRMTRLIEQHRSHWRKSASAQGAEKDLSELALQRLEALALIRRRDGQIVPLAAIARFSLAATVDNRAKE